MIKKKLEDLLLPIAKKTFPEFDEAGIGIELPKNADHGDFATPLAFRLAKKLRESPAAIAEKFREACDESDLPMTFSCVGGFVNITLKDKDIFHEVLRSNRPDFPDIRGPIILEYVSANPTGPLHIGHGRWAVIGDVIQRLLRYVGANVSTEFYINDAGNQIQLFKKSVLAARSGEPVPENGYHGDYIHELAACSEDPVLSMIERQKETLARVGVYFDAWFSESSLHQSDRISRTLTKIEAANLSYLNEGALWFKSENFGDTKDRVLIKADGALTYFTVDIAYHLDKIERGFHKIVNIWGADHHGYVGRLRAALTAIAGEAYRSDDCFQVIIGQLVSLFRDGEPVRMSKRTGDMISLDEVLDEIGSDALRFNLIQKSSDTHLEFDLALAKAQTSENPVYYIQYAHARMKAILAKAGEFSSEKPDLSSTLHPGERQLAFQLMLFHEIVYDAAIKLAGHKLATYALHLARCFHYFYEVCPILSSESETRRRRLILIERTAEVFAEVLGLLGISAPDKM